MLTLEKNISKSTLEHLYLIEKLPDSKIAEMYGVSNGRIHRLRNKYGIKAVEYYYRHHKQELDQKEKEFLIGSLLGDGHIRLRDKIDKRAYPQLMLEQSIKHAEYIRWSKNQIKDWLYDPSKPLLKNSKFNKKSNKTYHSYSFQTICHPVFDEFYNGFYKQRTKIIDIEFIKKYFSLFSLAIWIMDDGTLSNGRNISISTCSFTYDENKALSEFLNNKYSIKSNINKCSNYFVLLLEKDSSVEVSRLVNKYFIPEMLYKLISSETTKGTDENPKV